MNSFNKLSTVKFQQKLKPAAIKIYRKVFPGCEIVDLRSAGNRVHILDKEFGIDALINLPSGQWISIQEKYRDNWTMIKYLEFTQEFMNAVGTEHEAIGEWFKLGAQMYFYGWANKEETYFEKWLFIDILRYKILVENAGGLAKLGKLQNNKKHGKASFYGIKIKKLKSCIVTDYRHYL